MKSVIVDTSVWIEWLNGHDRDSYVNSRSRVLFMPAVVAMELYSGAKDRKTYRAIEDLVETFIRVQRLKTASWEDYKTAGCAMADLGWPASKKSNDTLIAACARRIGAEIWTKDGSDFGSLAKNLRVTLTVL